MATYDLLSSTPTSFKKGDILNCKYSGAVKQITLPKGKYKLECWGAQGGNYDSSYVGGKGGYSIGVITLKKNTVVFLYVGQQNNTYASSAGSTSGSAFNGGGYGTTSYYKSTYTYACAGGGVLISVLDKIRYTLELLLQEVALVLQTALVVTMEEG